MLSVLSRLVLVFVFTPPAEWDAAIARLLTHTLRRGQVTR